MNSPLGPNRLRAAAGWWRWHVLILAMAALIGTWAGAGASAQDGVTPAYRFPLEGLPDLVLPKMDAAKGRRYFATRACVVCHSVNGVGGTRASALDLDEKPEVIDVLTFVTDMWRGGRPMLNLQRRLLGEPVDLTAEELGALIAFLHDPAEQKRFSENDIPKHIRDFMAAEEKKRGR